MINLWQLVFITVVFGVYFNPVSAQENFVVTVGENKVFTEFNYHPEGWVTDDSNHFPLPSEIWGKSEGNTATSYARAINSLNGQSGIAYSLIGLQFDWDLNGYNWEEVKNWPVNVFITVTYTINADWEFPNGAANAGVLVYNPPVAQQFWIGHGLNTKGVLSEKNVTIPYSMTIEGLQELNNIIAMEAIAHAHLNKYGGPESIGYSQVAINSIKIEFLPDLSVSMDYKRDLKDYNTKDDKTVYGADSVIYTITVNNSDSVDATGVVVNDLLPSGLKFISADPQGVYDPSTGIWNVGNLVAGASAKLNIMTKVMQSGEITNKATLNEDSNPLNNEAKVAFNARNPVILVHGFNSNPSTWNTLSKRLKSEGIRHYIFDYSPGLQDPYFVAGNFNNWVNGYLRDEDYIGYQGKFDILSHSMGALVTRFWMEGNSANAGNVGQWIGIGPVNHGAAIADILVDPTIAPEIYNQLNLLSKIIIKFLPTDSDAVRNMITTDPEILALNSDGIAPGVIYRVIMGTNVRTIPKMDTVAKIGDIYQFTTEGDGIVANVQSMLIGSATTDYFSVNHCDIPKNRDIINRVITYLKNN